MRRFLPPFLLILLMFPMVSCWEYSRPIEVIRPVELAEVRALESYQKDFIGTLAPIQESDLAFAVPGTLSSLDIVDGSVVTRGQILARLDTDDYLLKVVAERESYLTAQSTMARNMRLLEREAVSVQEYQISRAKYQASRARFEYAESQLKKTLLTAPFNGSIQRVYVGDYQEVSAGMTVCKLINPNSLEVQFTLPQSDIRLTSLTDSYSVTFQDHPNVHYRAKISEVVDASVDGAGIPVTLSIIDDDFVPQRLGLKPGFPCTVQVDVMQGRKDQNMMVVPLSAIFVRPNGTDQMVWVYNPDSQQVTASVITTTGLVGTQDMIVSGGVQSGEMVVTAGVYQLSENQTVKAL